MKKVLHLTPILGADKLHKQGILGRGMVDPSYVGF